MTVIQQIDVTDTSPRIVLHASGEPLVMPGGNALLNAEFDRLGDDLLVHGPHGFEVVVHDYFTAGHQSDLLTASGARIDSDLVTTLSRPEGYLQLAQDQGTQADTNTAGAHPIGKVDGISGAVDVKHIDGTTAHLAQGAPVFQGDVITSGPDGQVAITFVDGTAFSLGAGARMTLDDLVYNPDGKENTFAASVLQGSFVFMTGSIAPSGNMAVKTPVGTIGIRGTTVVGHLTVEGSDSTFVLVPDAKTGHVGKVIFTNAGGTQTLDAANAATKVVSFFISPTEPVILPAQQVLELYDQILKDFYDQHGGAPAQHDQPGNQGSNEHQGNQAATDDLANFNTAAGPGAGGPGGTDPLAGTLGAIPPLPITVTFTGLDITGQVIFGEGGDGGFGGGGIPRDNQNPGGVHTIPGLGFTTIIGTPEGDTLDPSKISGPLHIFGEAGNDVITGGSFGDQIHGGPGDDILMGAGGNDQVFGDGGNDIIIGGSGLGNDHYDGGAGNDTVEYASATQTIIVNLTTGTASGDPEIGHDTLVNIENVIGGSGNDLLIGNAQDNKLDGGPGDDQLAGQGGNDTLIGGTGNDVAVFSGKEADYSVTYDAESGTYQVVDNVAGRDGTDTLTDIERIRFLDGEHNLADVVKAPTAPVDTDNGANQVVENATTGALVGITANATAFNGHDIVYSLLNDDGGAFTIDAATGQVSVADGSKLDFESQPLHTITIQASDGVHTSSADFNIGLQNVNEAPNAPVDINAADNVVHAFSKNGTEVGITAQATDPEGDPLTYTLSSNPNGLFAIDTSTGKVTVADSGNLTEGSYKITVEASDGHLTSHSDFSIFVGEDHTPTAPVDINDNSATNSVAEHAPIGTLVGITAHSTDADGDALTYSLTENPSKLFAIDPASGVVTVADSADLAPGSYEIKVQATDGKLTSESSFVINVFHVNHAPTAPADMNAADNTVTEFAVAGTAVGITANATDSDGDAVTYALTSNPGNLFAIDASKGIVTVAKPDGLIPGDYQITVQASDGKLSSGSVFTIHVSDIPGLVASGDVILGDPLIIGNTGKASLELLDGGTATVNTIIVGKTVTGDGTFTLDPGSTAGIADKSVITIGDAGLAHVSITGTAETPTTMLANWISIGDQATGNGTVAISGPGAAIVTSGDNNGIVVGNDGTGSLTVLDGAQVKVLDLEIGSSGTGTVTLTGDGSAIIVSNDTGNFGDPNPDEGGLLRVGVLDGSTGTLNVLAGAHVEIRAGTAGGDQGEGEGQGDATDGKSDPLLVIAEDQGSKGTVLLDGLGSSIAVSMAGPADPFDIIGTLNGPGIIVGGLGDGEMTVSNHATATMTGDEAYLDVGLGNWTNPDDTTPLVQSVLQVTSGGQVTITDHAGGLGGLLIGDYTDGNGKVVIDGRGSQIVVDSDGGARVGRLGTGELAIQNGGTLVVQSRPNAPTQAGLTIASSETANGKVTVSGAGSELRITSPNTGIGLMDGPFLMMAAGQSLLEVNQQGSVTIQGSGANMVIGQDASAHAAMTVASGGTVTVDGQAGDATVVVANHLGASGSLTVDGSGSHFIVDSEHGQMLIGAFLNTSLNGGGNGGSPIDTSNGGNGHVTVENSAALQVGSNDTHGTGDAEIIIGSHGSLDINNASVIGDISDRGGIISVGEHSIATGSVTGDVTLTSAASTLEIDAQGTGANQADKLNVSGDVHLPAATIDFHFLNNFAPQAGDTFSFLTAGGTLSANPGDLSLIARNVDPTFRFETVQNGETLQFHALTNAGSGNGDVFLGGNHIDKFTGGDGNDAIFGGAGNDILDGGKGTNLIQGGAGADQMKGGSGQDTFSFAAPTDSTHIASNMSVADNHALVDQITNFDASIDKLSFLASAFGISSTTINSDNFTALDKGVSYNGTNATGAAYDSGRAAFILDGNNNLIYDNNGKGAGYTIVAHIDVAQGSPAISEHNLQVT